MWQSTDTNMTSDQWCYFHKHRILIVIFLILKHLLFRLCTTPHPGNQLSFMQHELVAFLGCHSQSYRIRRTHSHRIRIVVKFTAICRGYGTDAF